MNLSTFQQASRDRVNSILSQAINALPEHSEKLKQAMEYALLIGGKRMRPFLVYATGKMLSVQEKDLDGPAAAIEAIHAYSLIHDDLPAMDNDDLRRGHPTCHIQFDEAIAILAGDALQTLAFEILCDYPLSNTLGIKRIELVKIISQAAGYNGMCGGQAMDLAATGQHITQKQLEDLHDKKTGSLLSACVEMTIALAVNITPQSRQHLMRFAKIIGLAFQVQDDILDVVSDSTVLGKPQGSDQAQNKSTYPAMLGLEQAQAYLEDLHQQALQALRALPYNTQMLVSFTDFVIHRTN
ncbi:(2E,6E)-farnesyl diphosphate synthase [Paraglaciecola psychrophila]|uniref:Polyprenyl synthetase n=1 Tax=Paraglaciecola psychrophila 170 TaxID=1129794 RepID=K6Z431_9ALTE|nr:(2E,6E)-farnesyl diphosphate synthase [Paraglaciecola psychrophila]AGH45972.1 polyprenyl synthetase [Paraglaciecola psychrophila 170]GAC39794.1 farnesyl diphosphate synthase [Paraglaciecola psychrophila 170]